MATNELFSSRAAGARKNVRKEAYLAANKLFKKTHEVLLKIEWET